MYHADIWDHEKLDGKSGYSSNSKYGSIFSEGKKDDLKYNDSKYGSESESNSDYFKKQDLKEDDKKEKENTGLWEQVEDKKQNLGESEQDLPKKAAQEIFNETQKEMKDTKSKKNSKSIEEAIQKAIKQEKDVIMMD